jgi:hypothetical protein
MCVTSLNGELAVYFDEWRGTPHDWMFDSTSTPENMIAVLPNVTGVPPLSWLGFRWYFKSNLWAIILPYWFLVLTAAALGALPWLCWRFSLRMLLIWMTVVAVVLGLIVVSF